MGTEYGRVVKRGKEYAVYLPIKPNERPKERTIYSCHWQLSVYIGGWRFAVVVFRIPLLRMSVK